jgi:hypothetical protein
MEGEGDLKRVLLSVVTILIVVIAFVVFRFGSALFQEGNPLPILISILKLELTKDDYEQFSETEQSLRYVSDGKGSSRYDVINDQMEEMGWRFKEQLGSGLVYMKDGDNSVIETRQYTKHYMIWNLPKEVINR